MNKEYIKELFEENKNNLIDYEINSAEELESIMESYVISNLQYDFHLYPDSDKLFNKENTKEITNEEVDVEK